MLVEHRIDDVYERLVAIEQSVPTCEQVTFEPAFALMLAQHLHHPAIQSEKFIVILRACVPLPVGHLKHGAQAVRKCFVGAENSKIALLPVELGYIAKEHAELMLSLIH